MQLLERDPGRHPGARFGPVRGKAPVAPLPPLRPSPTRNASPAQDPACAKVDVSQLRKSGCLLTVVATRWPRCVSAACRRLPLSASGRRAGLGATPPFPPEKRPRSPDLPADLVAGFGVAPSPRLRRDRSLREGFEPARGERENPTLERRRIVRVKSQVGQLEQPRNGPCDPFLRRSHPSHRGQPAN